MERNGQHLQLKAPRFAIRDQIISHRTDLTNRSSQPLAAVKSTFDL